MYRGRWRVEFRILGFLSSMDVLPEKYMREHFGVVGLAWNSGCRRWGCRALRSRVQGFGDLRRKDLGQWITACSSRSIGVSGDIQWNPAATSFGFVSL